MIPYIGGKSLLSKWIISEFPKDYKSKTYVEVFGGGGWVLFKKDKSNVEIYNDLNSTLVNLFTIIRDNYEVFKHKSEWSLHSREMFVEAIKKIKNDEFDCDIDKALAKAISQIQSFSGDGKSWGSVISPSKDVSGRWLPFLRKLDLINKRLKKVQIENLDFETLIKKYDRDTTIFYVDPPYVDTEFYYNKDSVNFRVSDHKRLAEVLKNISGKFVLSYYDHPFVRELYKDYRIEVKTNVKHAALASLRDNTTKPIGKELLIMNY